jgi:CheY-like chemotaxis protein
VLGAILALASSNLERLDGDSPMRKPLDTIARAASRGGELVASLLSLAPRTPAVAGEVALGPGGQGGARPLNLLVVDDDELMQDAMRDLLGMLGHTVSIASRGEEALAALEAGRAFDGVLLDVNMPGLGGVATLHRLRSLRPGLPVLLVTGKADQAVVDLVAACPGVALLPKPYRLDQLRQELQAWS